MEETNIEKETSCGAFNWRPKWLQKCASKKVYLVIYGLLGVVQGMSISYFRAVLSTLEKQFGIKSKQSAYLMSGKIISLTEKYFFFHNCPDNEMSLILHTEYSQIT